jgi:cell division protein FtsQ
MAKKVRGSSRYFFIFIFLLLLLYLIYSGINTALSHISWFKIKVINIKGNENLDKAFLLSLVNDFAGKNLFAINKDDIKTKFINVVRIKDIKVKKYLPNKLTIIIKERKGRFFIKTKDGILLPIDNDKIVLDNDRIYPNEVFPIIDTSLKLDKDIFVGKKVNDVFVDMVFTFADSLDSYDKDFLNTVSEFYKDKNDIVMIDRFNGNKIVFGNGNWKKKLSRFKHLKNILIDENGKKYKVVLKWNNDAVISSEVN